MRTSRRSLLVGATVTALLLPLTACGGDSKAADSANTKYKLVKPGVITAATQSEQPPFAVSDALVSRELASRGGVLPVPRTTL